jgi:hypothetical protein
MEQADAEIAFQRLNLLAERWLRHAQAQRRATEMKLFRDCNKIA